MNAGDRGHEKLAGKRVLITGGSSGIGLTIASQLIETGAQVAVVARGEEGLEDAAYQLGGKVLTIASDLTAANEATSAIEHAADRLGGLDVVVANAGAAVYGPFSESAPEDYESTIRITLLGTLNTAHAAISHLERSRGTLVVMGSVAGRLPIPWLSAYAAAKHGVRGFVRSLECELRARRSPVKVALIAPGPVDTPFWRRARTTDRRLPPRLRGAYRPEDVAAEVVRAAASPGRTERTVGALMIPALLADALFPNLILRPVGVAARLAWRKRDQRPVSDEDALARPVAAAEREGGLPSRPSALTKLRDAISARR